MRIPFRQGIARHQVGFLQKPANDIDLLVVNEHTIIHFAHKSQNYLFRETRTVIGAWSGPFIGGTDYWLYWDIHPVTAIRTFAHTLLEPVYGPIEPVSPAAGQMWFDTINDQMKEYSGSTFLNVIRVVAAKLESGAVIQAWNGGTTFIGSQIANYTANDAGSFIFDRSDLALRRADNTFITTIDGFASGIGSSSVIRIEALDFDAAAGTNIAAYTIVYLSDFDTVLPGNAALIANSVMGIIEEEALPGQRVNIVTSGVIRNAAWNWTTVNAPLYIDGTGQLTDVVQPGMNSIGFVVGPITIELKTAGITNVDIINNPVTNISHVNNDAATGAVAVDPTILWTTLNVTGAMTISFTAIAAEFDADVVNFTLEINDPSSSAITWPVGTIGDTTIDAGKLNIFTVVRVPASAAMGERFYVLKVPVDTVAPAP